jgi:monovalent cation:H+ antiporter-2, CPA2 family
MEVPIIKEIVIIFALSIVVLLICHRLKLPPVVGFLLTGILCGPHGLGFVKNIDNVQNLATIGVVLLLFTVGMEFSIKKIIQYKYYFFGGGALQVFFTLFATLTIAKYVLYRTWPEALFLGFLISLSSTAIVLRALDEKGDSDTPHGRLILGILIFQDIIAVPMMLLIPLLSGSSDEKAFDIDHIYAFLKGIAILAVMALVAFRAVPKLLYYVTRTRSRELFLLSILTICFAVAWITSSIGLSLSLGAFLAGLVISESEYSDEAVGNVMPFQEIFTSFFFVSMGMLLDLGFVFKQPLLIIAIALAILVLKGMIAGGSAILLGMPLRSVILTGIALSQVGEFSFVLAQSGMSLGLVSDYHYQLFLAVSLLTMAVTPSLMNFSNRLAAWALNVPLPHKLKTGYHYSEGIEKQHLSNHIIITGFGLRGKHLAHAAKEAEIPYIILEMNPETVKKEKIKGEPIHFGDPSHHSVLVHAGIKTAQTLAVVINDATAATRIVKMARSLNPDVYIIARTRYFQEAQQLFQIGATEVIPDEFGSSLEIFTRVLQRRNVQEAIIAKCINELRMEGYNLLNWHNNEAGRFSSLIGSSEARVETINLAKGSALIGKTIEESALRKTYGLTVLLIKRQNQTLNEVGPATIFQESDSVVVIGSPERLDKAQHLFQSV